MVNARDNGGATLVAVNQVYLPKRHVMAQGGAVEIGGELLEFELGAISCQGNPVDMVVDVKVGIIFPVVAAIVLHDFLSEALEAEQAIFQEGQEAEKV